jgi:hypothetical protein
MTIARQLSKYQIIIALELFILLLAFAIRLVYFNQLRLIFAPDFLVSQPFCGLDANSYHKIYALGILDGSWPDNRPFHHMILYPFFLAAIYTVVGVNLRIVVVGHILLEVLTCAAIFGIGRQVFDKYAGLLAALFFATFSPLIFFNPCFAQEVISIPLFAVTLFFLLKTQATSRLSYLLLAAITTSLAALSRPTYFLFIPIVALWWLLSRVPPWRIIWQGALYSAVVFLLTLPATLHNYRTDSEGHFSPTPVSGWEIFFLGNHPYAEGLGWVDYVLYVYLDVPGEQYAVDVRARADSTTRTVYRDEALQYIKNNPAAWLNLMWRKSYLLLLESDDQLISPYFVHNLQTVWFMIYLPLTWRSLFMAAFLGILLVKHKHKGFLVLLLTALIVFTLLFHIQYRFRLLFVPLAALYAAAFIVAAPRLSRWSFSLSLLILAGGALWLPELGWILGMFIIAASWPSLQQRKWRVVGWATLAVYSYTIAALLVIQIIAFATHSQQRQTLFLSPSVGGPVAMGQSFVVHCNGFNRVTLNLGLVDNLGRSAIFHLRDSPQSAADIYRVNINAAGLPDRAWYDFTFPPQPNSAGRAYFVYVDAPQPGSLSLRGTYDRPYNRYREGVAFIGHSGRWQEIPGDLAFSAHCDVGWVGLINQAFGRLAANRFGSIPFYWVVLLVHLGLLALALWKLTVTSNVAVQIKKSR